MPRRLVDDTQRRVAVSVSLRDALRQMVLAEAENAGLTLSAGFEALLTEALIARGYPEEIVKGVTKEQYTEDDKKRVIEGYDSSGNITEAARRARVSLSTVYIWLREDRDFARKIQQLRAMRHGPVVGANRSKFDTAYMAAETRIDENDPRAHLRRGGRPQSREVPGRGETWEDLQNEGSPKL